MASRNIKGITISIGGETTELQKALKEPEKNIRDLQSELGAINKSLQFQPGNIDLIGQKFEVVSGLVAETTAKLKTLEDAQAEVQRRFEAGEIGAEQYRAFQRELEATKDKTKQLADQAALIDSEFKRAATAAGESMQELGGKIESVGKSLGKFSAVAGGVIAASVKTFVDFDDAMRQVKATIGATEEEFKALSSAATEAGLSTKFTTTEAAEALNYLALAGYDAQKSIETLPKILTLAAAGNLELAYASDLVTDSLSALGLGTRELDRFIDELVKTSQEANADVAQLGEAILTVGGQATLAGLNTNDLNTALGILADNGIKGSEAGTALRNTLKNLYTPTDSASKAIQELGVSTTTANGELRDIQDVLADLDKALGRLSDSKRIEAMNKIFDSRTISAANNLIRESGERWNELSDEIANASGVAEETANTLEEGVGGAIRQLISSVQVAAKTIGDTLEPAIRAVAEVVQNFALLFIDLPAPIQGVIAVIVLLVAALGPLLILTGSIIKNTGVLIATLPKIIETVKRIASSINSQTAATIAQTAATKLAAAAQWLWNAAMNANPIGLVIIAITALIAILVVLYKNIDSFAAAVDKIFESIGIAAQKFADSIKTLFTKTIPDSFNNFINFFKQSPYEIGTALGEMIGQVLEFSAKFQQAFDRTISNAIANIGNFVRQLPSQLQKGFSQAISAVNQWGKDFVTSGIRAMQDFVSGVIQKLSSLPAQFAQLGRDMIQGFINGIKEMFKNAIKAVTDFFKGIVDGVKGVLGIKSPSKVFAGIGEDSADGWLVGWSDEIQNVRRQLGNAVSDLVDFGAGGRGYNSGELAAASASPTPTNYTYIDQKRQYFPNWNRVEQLVQASELQDFHAWKK